MLGQEKTICGKNHGSIFSGVRSPMLVIAVLTVALFYGSPTRVNAGASLSGLTYQGIKLSNLFGPGSVEYVMDRLGSEGYDEYKLFYDDIEFYHENGSITRLEGYDTSLFDVFGVSLNKNKAGLIRILGNPDAESETNGYTMEYHEGSYWVCFELGDPDSPAWRITVSNDNNAAVEDMQDGQDGSAPSDTGDSYTTARDNTGAKKESGIISRLLEYIFTLHGLLTVLGVCVGLSIIIQILEAVFSKAKCPKCGKRKADIISKERTGQARIDIKKKEVITHYSSKDTAFGKPVPGAKMSKNTSSSTREYTVPGTRTYYDAVYVCRVCGYEFSREEFADTEN